YQHVSKPGTIVKSKCKGITSNLKIYYKKQLIFDQYLDKVIFEEPEESYFCEHAILQTVAVDELRSIKEPLIHIRFYNTVQNAFKAYQITVYCYGAYHLEFIDGIYLS